MSFPAWSRWLAALGLVLLAPQVWAMHGAQTLAVSQPQTVTIGGSAMLGRATGDYPAYPKDSLARGVSGVVVIEVVADTEGRTTGVTILQAPDSSIADATRQSLLRWKFKPITYQGQKVNVRAKVIWYFLVEGGRARVIPASESPTENMPSEPVDDYPTIGLDEWQRLRTSKAPPVLLDVSPRSASAKPLEAAVRIPEDELWARASVELPRSAVIVVDCPTTRAEYCSAAARQLSAFGYRTVMLLVRK